MFDKIDDIPWETLTIAYEKLEPTPFLLRQLAFGKLEQQEEAYNSNC